MPDLTQLSVWLSGGSDAVGAVVAGAVEAVGADVAFGQADGFDDVFEGAEAERRQPETAAYLFDHAGVFRRVGGGVGFEVAVVAALEVGYDAPGDKLERAF